MKPTHPLEGVGLTVKNFKSFGEEGGSFDDIQPINILIGRNNSGKSALIDAIELCIEKGKIFDPPMHARSNASLRVDIKQLLDEESLIKIFRVGAQGGGIHARDHWAFGRQFVGQRLTRYYGPEWVPKVEAGPDLTPINPQSRGHYHDQLAKTVRWPFDQLRLLRVTAERDVQPENKTDQLTLAPGGRGTTNLIRAFINSVRLPREEVEQKLLEDLNSIYRGDSIFSRIACQENDNGIWEIYLREEAKGDIRLSQSGSSLKSVFIILCLMRLVPIVENIDWSKVVVAIEEPENNLHPSLLRRLLNFLADIRQEKGFTLVVTTHSPVGIDWSAKRSDSQIVHVKHDGHAAVSRPAISYLQGRDILDDLDIRASDILQANGVIWVEGPSDRIYLRRWIELISEGQLKEDVHYTVMFYGGKLLSRLSARAPDEIDDSISLLRINRNSAVIIDSDRHIRAEGKGARKRKPRLALNKTKTRIKKEIESVTGFLWVTSGREIENYTPINVYEQIVGESAPKNIDIYTKLPEHSFLNKFKGSKIDIAHAVASKVQAQDIKTHLDLWEQLEALCSHIRRWNKLV